MIKEKESMINQNETIKSLLEKVSNSEECTRAFEVELTEFVDSLEDKSTLKALLDSADENERFLGIYGLSIYYKHLMEFDKLEYLLSGNEDLCEKHKSLGHLRTILYIESDASYLPEEVEKHLLDAYEVANAYKNMDRSGANERINVAGAQHAFADLFATYCEKYEEIQEKLIEKWYKKALEAVETAIQFSPDYAKYYSTKGRILSQNHNYEDALKFIQKAICIESPEKNKNYSLRIMQYQSHKLNVQAKFQIYKINTQQKGINDDIVKMKGALASNIETIGFFAGIISFIIGSLTLADGQTAKDAAALILILLGALLVVFDSFSFLLNFGKKSAVKHILVLLGGILVILGGLFLVW